MTVFRITYLRRVLKLTLNTLDPEHGSHMWGKLKAVRGKPGKNRNLAKCNVDLKILTL